MLTKQIVINKTTFKIVPDSRWMRVFKEDKQIANVVNVAAARQVIYMEWVKDYESEQIEVIKLSNDKPRYLYDEDFEVIK